MANNNQEQVHLFNLETMSGVSPGIRTRIMQRLQIYLLDERQDDDVAANNQDLDQARPAYIREETEATGWVRLLWYAGPDGTEQAESIDGATCRVQRQSRNGADEWSEQTAFSIDRVSAGTLRGLFQQRLAVDGSGLKACASCLYWSPISGTTDDGLPIGQCTKAQETQERLQLPPSLARQSLFAPACRHWNLATIEEQIAGATTAKPSDPPEDGQLPRAAVIEKEREAQQGLWSRLRRLVSPMSTSMARSEASEGTSAGQWAGQVIERSGVGAGTEACFACQGRIANLGALMVATDEDDKHTYSVWRCRTCYTTYLNSWVDRWERLDNLETEETWYRPAPVEALAALAMIDGVSGGEHPQGRQQRVDERSWFEALAQRLTILSHQVKQGR